MFSKALSAIFIIFSLLFLYLTWEVSRSYAIYIIPFFLAFALTYVFSPQIDWWWMKRNPPKPDPMVEMLLKKYHRFYQKLALKEKKRFIHRIQLYELSLDFKPQGMQSVPRDVKAMIAAAPVWLTFGERDLKIAKFENIITYKQPFPSPQYPNTFHTSELFEKDGVIMLSIQHMMKGALEPELYFHSALYEFARAFVLQKIEVDFPKVDENVWTVIPHLSGLTQEKIQAWIGIDEIDPLGVLIVHFFVFPERFKELLPGEYQMLEKAFKLDMIAAAVKQ